MDPTKEEPLVGPGYDGSGNGEARLVFSKFQLGQKYSPRYLFCGWPTPKLVIPELLRTQGMTEEQWSEFANDLQLALKRFQMGNNIVTLTLLIVTLRLLNFGSRHEKDITNDDVYDSGGSSHSTFYMAVYGIMLFLICTIIALGVFFVLEYVCSGIWSAILDRTIRSVLSKWEPVFAECGLEMDIESDPGTSTRYGVCDFFANPSKHICFRRRPQTSMGEASGVQV